MRYRPFNQAGLAVSAITLTLDDQPLAQADRLALIFAALEAGINSFELACLSTECTTALRAAIQAAGRKVLVLTLRLPGGDGVGGDAAPLDLQVNACLDQIGAQHLDAVLVEAAAAASPDVAARLQSLRGERLVGMIGVDCGPAGPDASLARAGYNIIATPFGLRADAALRKRLRTMVESNMVMIGYDFDDMAAAGADGAAPPAKGLSRFFKRGPSAAELEADPYAFLHRTPTWTATEIALAYALTEPSFSTFRVKTTDPQALDRLAKTVERELPNGAAAQIEMARFSAPA
jgi:aryl-alcohol dehydrogenase-like predicted oxidoreductase